MPFVIERFDIIAFDYLPAAKALFSKLFVVVLLTIWLSITMEKAGVPKWFATNGANKVLRVPLMSERLDVLSDYFLVASLAVNHTHRERFRLRYSVMICLSSSPSVNNFSRHIFK